MISPEGLKHLNREAAVRSAAEGKEPVLLTEEDWQSAVEFIGAGVAPAWIKNIPYLGDLEDWQEEMGDAREFEIVETLFHDITGYNLRNAGGPALSVYDWARKCRDLCAEHGPLYFILVSAYQFQGYTDVLKLSKN